MGKKLLWAFAGLVVVGTAAVFIMAVAKNLAEDEDEELYSTDDHLGRC